MGRITLEDKDQFNAIGRELVEAGASIHVRARAVLEVGLEIQRKGWCQRNLALSADAECIDPESAEACYWCMTGAVSAAWWWIFREGFGHTRHEVVGRALTILYPAALEVSARGGKTVAGWNDYPGRRQEQAIEAFQIAIRRAA